MLTSVRLRPAWSVQVAEDAPLVDGVPAVPPPPAGHARCPLAQLERPAGHASIESEMITDLRQTQLNLDAVERRMRVVEQRVLRPVLAPGREFSPQTIGPGGTIHIFGRNLDLMPVAVAFGSVSSRCPRRASRRPTSRQGAGRCCGWRLRRHGDHGGGTVQSAGKLSVDAAIAIPVFDPPPDEFSPPSGPADTPVTIRGRNMGPEPVKVLFGVQSVDGRVADPTTVVAKVPDGLTQPVKLTVVTPRGRAETERKFVPGRKPVLVSISPLTTPPNSVVTLNGSNFSNASVSFDDAAGVPRPVRVLEEESTDIEINVRMPLDMAPGEYTVTVTTPVGSTSSSNKVTVY